MKTLSEITIRLNEALAQFENLKFQNEGLNKNAAFYSLSAQLYQKITKLQVELQNYGKSTFVFQVEFSMADDRYRVILANLQETEIIKLITLSFKNADNITYKQIPVGKLQKI